MEVTSKVCYTMLETLSADPDLLKQVLEKMGVKLTKKDLTVFAKDVAAFVNDEKIEEEEDEEDEEEEDEEEEEEEEEECDEKCDDYEWTWSCHSEEHAMDACCSTCDKWYCKCEVGEDDPEPIRSAKLLCCKSCGMQKPDN